MVDPAIKGLVNWWFMLITFFSSTAFAGVVVFIWTVGGALMLLLLVWLKRKVDAAPEMIEEFLRRLGLYRSPEK